MEPSSSRSAHNEDTKHSVVRDMVREGRMDPSTRAGTAASADAVETVRRAVRDLKHDVRMLKVGMDKQTQLIEELSRRVDDLHGVRGRRG